MANYSTRPFPFQISNFCYFKEPQYNKINLSHDPYYGDPEQVHGTRRYDELNKEPSEWCIKSSKSNIVNYLKLITKECQLTCPNLND